MCAMLSDRSSLLHVPRHDPARLLDLGHVDLRARLLDAAADGAGLLPHLLVGHHVPPARRGLLLVPRQVLAAENARRLEVALLVLLALLQPALLLRALHVRVVPAAAALHVRDVL